VNGRQALGCRRNLDHQIAPIDFPPQTFRFLDGSLRVGCEKRRHFDADKAVGAVRGVKYGSQDIGRVANVLDRELLEDLRRRMVMARQHPLDGVVIFFGMADGMLENGRV